MISAKKLILGTAVILVLVPLVGLAQVMSESEDTSCVPDINSDNVIVVHTNLPGISYRGGPDSNLFYVKDYGCFIIGAYKYFAGVAGVLATVMMMWGGMKYVISFGSAQKFQDAQDTIVSAMVGLALVLGSYMILYTINPGLVQFGDLKIPKVVTIEQEVFSWKDITFCKGKGTLTTRTCGEIWEGSDQKGCMLIGFPAESNSICRGKTEGGYPQIEPITEIPLIIDGKQEIYRGNRDRECGTIIYQNRTGSGLGSIAEIGTGCTGSDEGCLIILDDAFRIYRGEGLVRPGENVIGSFINWVCQ